MRVFTKSNLPFNTPRGRKITGYSRKVVSIELGVEDDTRLVIGVIRRKTRRLRDNRRTISEM